MSNCRPHVTVQLHSFISVNWARRNERMGNRRPRMKSRSRDLTRFMGIAELKGGRPSPLAYLGDLVYPMSRL